MVKLGANVLTEILSLIFTRKEEIKGKSLKMTMDLCCHVTEDTLFSEMNKMEQKRSLIEKWFKSGVVEQIHCIQKRWKAYKIRRK